MTAMCRMALEWKVSAQSMGLGAYLGLFILTCLLEAPIYWLGLRLRLSTLRIIWATFFLNLASHPTITWIYPWIFSHSHLLVRDYMVISEISAIVIEGALLVGIYKISASRAYCISFLANTFSWWVGLYIASPLGL